MTQEEHTTMGDLIEDVEERTVENIYKAYYLGKRDQLSSDTKTVKVIILT